MGKRGDKEKIAPTGGPSRPQPPITGKPGPVTSQVLKGASQTHRDALIRLKDR